MSLLSLKLQFNRLHCLTWILSIKIRTFGACGGRGVRTHPVPPPPPPTSSLVTDLDQKTFKFSINEFRFWLFPIHSCPINLYLALLTFFLKLFSII